MANCCFYTMKAVSNSRDALERLLAIMKYEDREFFLYRVQDVYTEDEPHQEGDLWVMRLRGDVAWSTEPWVNGATTQKKADNGAAYSNLNELCRVLGIAVEIWAEESGMQFQEHYVVGTDGRLGVSETTDWEATYDDGELIGENGGFGDRYVSFMGTAELYAARFV